MYIKYYIHLVRTWKLMVTAWATLSVGFALHLFINTAL